MKLGKIKKIDLRTIWASESSDFTPWLAKEENIALLSDAIGMDLEVESQEKNVGPFRADILARDVATNHYVLIENQLEQTNHNHLGQIMTYAAGLDAFSIIWIAKSFTEEHRAALDWLNRITDENINFFGIEVRLFKLAIACLLRNLMLWQSRMIGLKLSSQTQIVKALLKQRLSNKSIGLNSGIMY